MNGTASSACQMEAALIRLGQGKAIPKTIREKRRWRREPAWNKKPDRQKLLTVSVSSNTPEISGSVANLGVTFGSIGFFS
jgi:hypothetical protein